jgi:hypothetical protein
MLRRVALVRTDVSEKTIASFIRVTRISELGTTVAGTSNGHTLLVAASVVPSSPILVVLMKEAQGSSTLRNIPEDIVTAVKTSNLTQLALFLVHRFLSP